MKKINASTYTKDQLYGAVANCVASILRESDVVTPVDVLLKLQRITKQQYEDWRFGRIPYLERVCVGNLSKLNRILRILDQHARTVGLTASQTTYRKWGKGGKQITLRFSKGGDKHLEAAYSRVYTRKSRRPPDCNSDASRPDSPSSNDE